MHQVTRLPSITPILCRVVGWLMVPSSFLLLCEDSVLRAQEVRPPDPQAKVDFRQRVAPILKQQCVACHNSQLEMAGLRLDTVESAFDSGTIERGDSENSLLIQRLHDKDLGITMPPRRKLSPSETKSLKLWIDQGAEWPNDVVLFTENEADLEDSETRALFAAIRSGKHGLVKKLWKQVGTKDELIDQIGFTPLHQAAWVGNVPTLRFLLSQVDDVDAANPKDITPLMLAIGNRQKTELLLEAGAKVDVRSESGRTPLLLAASKANNSSVLKQLIAAGADVNAKDGRGWTPLIMAARTGDVRMLQVLLDAGAQPRTDVAVRRSPGTPVTQAAWTGDVDCVRLLLERTTKKRPPEQKQDELDLALIFAATHGYEKVVDLLVQAGADSNANSYTGYVPDTPLMAAAYSDRRSQKIVQCLIDRDANSQVVGRKGQTAASYAAMRADPQIVALIGKSDEVAEAEPDTAQARGAVSPGEVGDQHISEQIISKQHDIIEASLALIQKCDLQFFNSSGCVACHQQSTSAVTTSLAEEFGFIVDSNAAEQRQKLLAFELEKLVPGLMQRHKIGGTTHRIGYILWGLSAGGYAQDTSTDAAVYELSGLQLRNGSWVSDAHRPPTEYSPFSATAVSVLGLRDFGPAGLKPQLRRQIRRARTWLESTAPHEQQEFVFRLLGLKWAGSSEDKIDQACQQLIDLQNHDGGWSQLPNLPSDAYATGLSLYALHVAGGIPVDASSYEKGVAFLLRSQTQRGIWRVESRSYGFQPYFESGFPFEEDQWISSAAAAWATTALMFATERE